MTWWIQKRFFAAPVMCGPNTYWRMPKLTLWVSSTSSWRWLSVRTFAHAHFAACVYDTSHIYTYCLLVGYPLISGIGYATGLRTDTSPGDQLLYLLRFFDALVYFWLPQINVFILRLIQGRNLRHRMVGRTVVIGDPCPWVAQSAEAFLSKIFACSYSIAGLNVLSGNPADHLVHRHTHRVVRGSLFVSGRPDGRLSVSDMCPFLIHFIVCMRCGTNTSFPYILISKGTHNAGGFNLPCC